MKTDSDGFEQSARIVEAFAEAASEEIAELLTKTAEALHDPAMADQRCARTVGAQRVMPSCATRSRKPAPDRIPRASCRAEPPAAKRGPPYRPRRGSAPASGGRRAGPAALGPAPVLSHGRRQGVEGGDIQRARRNGRDRTFLRGAFQHRRCLIAADGWVEWKGEGKPKPKLYIDPGGGAPTCFAGLWERSTTSDAGCVKSFTMVTQPPGVLSDVHDRAPVVLRQDEWARWIDPQADVSDLLTAEPADLYTVRPFT